MDLVTQGLLGASLAASTAPRDELRKAALIGLLAGFAADLDYLIRSDSDPLLNLEFHRHFTHSLIFIPVAALLLSFLLWPFFRKHMSWRRVFRYSLLGYLLSGLLDACTSYGTSLLWPFTDTRFSFNIISIIDPIFSLLLVFGLAIGIWMQRANMPRTMLVLAGAYLALGWWQQQQIKEISEQIAQQQGLNIDQLLVKPTLGNIWLWRSIYLAEGRYHVNAIRRNPVTGAVTIFPGASIARLDLDRDLPGLPDHSVLAQDIRRFAHFSDRFLALHPRHDDIIIDVRYSNLPNSVLPLWGLRFDARLQDQHARYEIYRDRSATTRQRFFDMLFSPGQASEPQQMDSPA